MHVYAFVYYFEYHHAKILVHIYICAVWVSGAVIVFAYMNMYGIFIY